MANQDTRDAEREDLLATLHDQGDAHIQAGDKAGAIAAFRAARTVDPDDPGGAVLRLAALGAEPPPEMAPRAYVERLFDQSAHAFDDHMCEALGYHVPELMRAMLLRHAPGPYRRLIDLGCGTGLVAEAFEGLFDEAVGVDLSRGMLAKAAEKGRYVSLLVGDVAEVMAAWSRRRSERFDLAVAADVLIYLGDLAPFLGGLAAVVRPGGLALVSTERLETGEQDAGAPEVTVRNSRFVHSDGYLARGLLTAGFEIVSMERTVLRLQNDTPIEGTLTLARRGGSG
ncbi:MAG: class I SAM-dependent DNA methyltransferase [Pikeienuella sp.]